MTDSKESILSYTGYLEFETIGNLAQALKEKKDQQDIGIRAYKKLLSALIESLENIYKYNQVNGNGNNTSLSSQYLPFIDIVKSGTEFILTTGNIVKNQDRSIIENKINQVKRLDKDQIKELYKEVIRNGHFTENGGAGLGFIELARLANFLEYNFNPINDEWVFYKLIIHLEN